MSSVRLAHYKKKKKRVCGTPCHHMGCQFAYLSNLGASFSSCKRDSSGGTRELDCGAGIQRTNKHWGFSWILALQKCRRADFRRKYLPWEKKCRRADFRHKYLPWEKLNCTVSLLTYTSCYSATPQWLCQQVWKEIRCDISDVGYLRQVPDLL